MVLVRYSLSSDPLYTCVVVGDVCCSLIQILGDYLVRTAENAIIYMGSNEIKDPALACAAILGILEVANQGYHVPYVLASQAPKFLNLVLQTMDKIAVIINHHASNFPVLLLQYLGGDETYKRYS